MNSTDSIIRSNHLHSPRPSRHSTNLGSASSFSQPKLRISPAVSARCHVKFWAPRCMRLPRLKASGVTPAGRSKKSGEYKILYQKFNKSQLGGRLQTAKRQQVELQAWQTTPTLNLSFKNCTKNGPECQYNPMRCIARSTEMQARSVSFALLKYHNRVLTLQTEARSLPRQDSDTNFLRKVSVSQASRDCKTLARWKTISLQGGKHST